MKFQYIKTYVVNEYLFVNYVSYGSIQALAKMNSLTPDKFKSTSPKYEVEILVYYKGKKVEAKGIDTDQFGYGPAMRSELRKKFPSKPGLKVLDVGTGFGKNIQLLNDSLPGDRQIWSIDPSEEALANAGKIVKEKEIHDVVLAKGNAESHPLDKNFFDMAISSLVMHHMTDVRAGIAGMLQSLQRGGLLVISDWAPPAHKLPFTQLHREEDFVPFSRVLQFLNDMNTNPKGVDFNKWYLFTATRQL